YQHSGQEIYFNRRGQIKRYGYLRKRHDRWQGFLEELRSWRIDHLGDHSIHNYCEYLTRAVQEEHEAVAAGGEAFSPERWATGRAGRGRRRWRGRPRREQQIS